MSSTTADWLQPPIEQQGVGRYLQTIRERARIVIVVMALVVGLALIYVLSTDKVYEARSDVLVTPLPVNQGVLVGLGLIRESNDPALPIETAAQLLTTRDVAVRVKQRLNSPKTPEALLADVSAEPVAQSDIVAIVADGSSASGAADLANAFATAAIDERSRQLENRVDKILPRLEAQLRSLPQGELAAQELASNIAQLEALKAGKDPTLAIESEAVPPSSPKWPRPALTLIAAIIGGFLLGVALAFVARALDTRLRREQQLRQLFRLPVLARVPAERSSDDDPLTPTDMSPAAHEAYRTLRATLAGRHRKPGPQAILLTGSVPSEGKTTSAISLATAFAMAGKEVILIEGDLRRPTIGRALDVSPRYGVVNVLIESATIAEALVPAPTMGGNLKLLLADYEGPGNAAELFSLPAAHNLIDEAKKLADVVVIDSPPLTAVIDALPLTARADSVVVVARMGLSNLTRIKELGELLADNHIRPAGFALLGVAGSDRDSSYYYQALHGFGR